MNDEERLVVAIEARIRDFERNMTRASQSGAKNFDAIERRAKLSGDRLEKTMGGASARVAGLLKNFGAGLAGGIIGGLSVAGLEQIVGKVGKIAEGVANIGSAAKRAGLDVRAFQQLGYVADQNRIPLDALTDGMKELQLRADEFVVTGGGSAAEAFKRIGLSASQLRDRLRDPAELFVEIIARLEQLDRASQIRIADELFGGTAGERFVELLDRGAEGIRRQMAEAEELGLVLDADVIQRADEIDRKFKAIAATVGTVVKGAVVDVASALSDWLESFNEIEERTSRVLGDQLADIGQQRLEIENKILELQAEQRSVIGDGLSDEAARNAISEDIAELQRERDALHETEKRILKALGDREQKAKVEAEAAAPAIGKLSDAITGTGAATGSATSGLTSYTDAIRALKNEIPELAEQLATLDARSRIDSTYRAALNKARSIGETIEATRLRDAALVSVASAGARTAADRGMLDLIAFSEGTDRRGVPGYNTTLDYGRWTGGEVELVRMTLNEVLALGDRMRTPENRALYGNGRGSSALGRYQITGATLRGLISELGLTGGEFFDAGLQDALAQQLLRRRGNDPAGLRSEWQGLRGVDDATIRRAFDGESIRMPAVDPTKSANADRLREQTDAYSEIIASAKQYTAAQGLEREALDMTAVRASALRHETDMLTQAQRAGITVTPQQRTEIQQLALGMSQAEAAAQSYAETQAQAAETSRFFGQQAVDALSGILTGTMTAEQAIQQLLQTMIRAGLQFLLLGEGPLAGLFGGGVASPAGGGIAGGLLGMLFGGFAEGGFTGHGDKYEPAGVVHRGEVVWSQRDVARAGGVGVVEAMRVNGLPGFADGGIVLPAAIPALPALASPVTPVSQ